MIMMMMTMNAMMATGLEKLQQSKQSDNVLKGSMDIYKILMIIVAQGNPSYKHSKGQFVKGHNGNNLFQATLLQTLQAKFMGLCFDTL